MNKTNDESHQIYFRISQIKKNAFFEKDLASLGATVQDLATLKIDLAINIGQNSEEGLFIIKFRAIYKIKDNLQILGIESESIFSILDHQLVLKNDDCGNMLIPQDILNKFAAIAVGATRGMLAVMNTNPQYQEYVLPPINIEKMLSEENRRKY